MHQRLIHSGPLVLGATLLKFLTPTPDRDRTVSRMLFPRITTGMDYTFTLNPSYLVQGPTSDQQHLVQSISPYTR